jgi:hypothetical protein
MSEVRGGATVGRLRVAASVALLAGGALHARLAFGSYGTRDLITLFFVNGIGSALVAGWMLYARSPLPLFAALGISAVSLAAFGLSRVGGGVIGFRGVGLEPSPDALLTLVSEGVAMLLIGASLVAEQADVRTLAREIRARVPVHARERCR